MLSCSSTGLPASRDGAVTSEVYMKMMFSYWLPALPASGLNQKLTVSDTLVAEPSTCGAKPASFWITPMPPRQRKMWFQIASSPSLVIGNGVTSL
jgi:hypothetical protein